MNKFDVGSVVTLKSIPEGRMTINNVYPPGSLPDNGFIDQSQPAYSCAWIDLDGGLQFGVFSEAALQISTS